MDARRGDRESLEDAPNRCGRVATNLPSVRSPLSPSEETQKAIWREQAHPRTGALARLSCPLRVSSGAPISGVTAVVTGLRGVAILHRLCAHGVTLSRH